MTAVGPFENFRVLYSYHRCKNTDCCGSIWEVDVGDGWVALGSSTCKKLESAEENGTSSTFKFSVRGQDESFLVDFAGHANKRVKGSGGKGRPSAQGSINLEHVHSVHDDPICAKLRRLRGPTDAHHFSSLHPSVVSQLPLHVQLSMPFRYSPSGYVVLVLVLFSLLVWMWVNFGVF